MMPIIWIFAVLTGVFVGFCFCMTIFVVCTEERTHDSPFEKGEKKKFLKGLVSW